MYRKCRICRQSLADCNKEDICFRHQQRLNTPSTPNEKHQNLFTSRPQPLLHEEFHSQSTWL